MNAMPAAARRRLIDFGIAAGIFALDRATKVVIERTVSIWDSHTVIPGLFNIVYTRNPGMAFGLLADAPPMVRKTALLTASVSILVFVVVLLWRASAPAEPSPERRALVLVLGGALGNIYDRAVYGSVTDFLQFFIGPWEFPSFNVADSAISVGAALMVLDLIRFNRNAVPANHVSKAD
ncbi:MAG: signal peptidase II [Acidobacteria bacterium]|nr:signal peptidase II [Acidobacteriota bacterium]